MARWFVQTPQGVQVQAVAIPNVQDDDEGQTWLCDVDFLLQPQEGVAAGLYGGSRAGSSESRSKRNESTVQVLEKDINTLLDGRNLGLGSNDAAADGKPDRRHPPPRPPPQGQPSSSIR